MKLGGLLSGAGVIIVVVLVADALLLIFKGDDLIRMEAEKRLRATLASAEKALPPDADTDDLRKAFDQALAAARAGHIGAEELAGFLLGTRSDLEDGRLTSEEMDSMVQQLNQMANAELSSG